MSIDYDSTCLATSPATAQKITSALAPRQRCGAIVGANEQNLVDAWVGVADIDVAELAAEYDGEEPPEEFWESASVHLRESELDLLEASRVVLTNRSSALAGLDRALALPRGVALMSGHAIAHIPCARIEGLEFTLARLWKRLGGRAAAASKLQRYLYGNANEDMAAAVIALVEDTLAKAKRDRLDVVLLSAVSF
jgi:hypothetical protein